MDREHIVTGGSVGVKVNDELGYFFQTKKGLRRGDPLSPVLFNFNLVADMLAILISRATKHEQFKGLGSSFGRLSNFDSTIRPGPEFLLAQVGTKKRGPIIIL